MAESESKQPFTEAGECLDEVTFVFDDEQKLYVSQNFLYYVSPVFKAMFENDFKEKETRIVKLQGKCYDNFLDFLLCLHPGEQKSIDDKNVLRIIELAEEYQAKLIVKRCKNVMSGMLEAKLKSAIGCSSVIEKLRCARACLQILSTAEMHHYDEIVTAACKTLGQFGHAIFTGTVSESEAYPRRLPLNPGYSAKHPYGISLKQDPIADCKFYGYDATWVSSKPENEDPLADCKNIFRKLSAELQSKLLMERLRLRDDLEMYKPPA